MSLRDELRSTLSRTVQCIRTEEQERWQKRVEEGYQGAADSARRAAEENMNEASYEVHCERSPEDTKRLAEDIVARLSLEGVRAVLNGGVKEYRWNYGQWIKISF